MSDDVPVYHESHMRTIRGLDHIRLNLGMYIGGTDPLGLHHLVWELLSNSLDEVWAGNGNLVGLTLHADGSCSVIDVGRGIPVQVNPTTGQIILVEAMMEVGASWKLDEQMYRTAFGLRGLGLKVVNALSQWCRVETHRNGRLYAMEFARGNVTRSLQHLGSSDGRIGTAIRFKPDPEVFGDLTFDIGIILHRLCILAFLNSGVRFTFTDDRTGCTDVFHFDDGLAAYVNYLNTRRPTLHEPISIRGAEGSVRVEVALQFHAELESIELGYVNSATTRQGGTHTNGFRRGLMLALKQFANELSLFPTNLKLEGEDFRDGLTAVVNVFHPEPIWRGATRESVQNPELDGIVSRVVRRGIGNYLSECPSFGRKLCKHIVLCAEARIGAAAARKHLRAKKNDS